MWPFSLFKKTRFILEAEGPVTAGSYKLSMHVNEDMHRRLLRRGFTTKLHVRANPKRFDEAEKAYYTPLRLNHVETFSDMVILVFNNDVKSEMGIHVPSMRLLFSKEEFRKIYGSEPFSMMTPTAFLEVRPKRALEPVHTEPKIAHAF